MFCQRIEDGENGNADKHTDDAEEAGHDGDRRDDPNGRKSCGCTVDTGGDDIAVDLLNHKDHDCKINGVHRIVYEEDDRTRDRTNEGTENRNNIGDADDNTDQRCIGHTEKLHEKEADEADEQGVEDGTHEIFAEGLIRQRDDAEDLFVILLAQDGLRKLLCLCCEMFFGA